MPAVFCGFVSVTQNIISKFGCHGSVAALVTEDKETSSWTLVSGEWGQGRLCTLTWRGDFEPYLYIIESRPVAMFSIHV